MIATVKYYICNITYCPFQLLNVGKRQMPETKCYLGCENIFITLFSFFQYFFANASHVK